MVQFNSCADCNFNYFQTQFRTVQYPNRVLSSYSHNVFTGPPNGPVLFCSLTSVVVCRLSSSVTLPASGWTGRPPGARTVGRTTLHGGPVVLRPVMTTPCICMLPTTSSPRTVNVGKSHGELSEHNSNPYTQTS